MTLVRIINDWKWLHLMRQTPEGKGVWDGVQFTEEPVGESDYVIILNRVPQETRVRCSPASVWAVIQEPPVPEYRWLEKGFDHFARVYAPDTNFKGPRFCYTRGALPWHVNRDYDFLEDKLLNMIYTIIGIPLPLSRLCYSRWALSVLNDLSARK